MNEHYVSAVILAAGSSSRMHSDTTKQLMNLSGKSILQRSLEAYQKSSAVNEIIVVARECEISAVSKMVDDCDKVKCVVIGGKSRAESAKTGFYAISEKSDFVAFHDAARCMISVSDIEKVISDAFRYGAATASIFVTDTVKEVDECGYIKFTHNRSLMRFVQTPQVFSCELYRKALEKIDINDPRITDDNFLLENISYPVFCTETSALNFKITTPEDVKYADFLLKGEREFD